MRKKNVLRISAVVLGAALLAAACGSDKKSSRWRHHHGGRRRRHHAAAGRRRASAMPSPSASSVPSPVPNANLGINIQKGAELALDQFAEKNPDCKVSLTDYDSQGSKDQSPALAKKAIDDKAVVGILGPAFSGESRAAEPAAQRGRPAAHHPVGHRRRPVDQRLEDVPPGTRHRRPAG